MSGTELSRVRTEFRLRPPSLSTKATRVERGRHCYAIKFGPLTARRPDDVYFASAARFIASPAYCLHLSCMLPAICAQRLKASAASLYRLMF